MILRRAILSLLVLTAGLMALAGGLLWRTQQAPLPITAVQDRIAAAVSAALPGADIAFAKAALHWRPRADGVDLDLREVRLKGLASLPEMAAARLRLRLAASALARGELRLVSASIEGLTATLDWRAAWPGDDGAGAPDYGAARAIVRDKLAAALRLPAMRRWQSFEVRDARLILREAVSGASHDLIFQELVFSPQAGAVRVAGAGALAAGAAGGKVDEKAKAALVLMGGFDPAGGEGTLSMALSAPRVAALSRDLFLAGWQGALDMPGALALEARFAAAPEEDRIKLALGLGPGIVQHDAVYPSPRAFAGGTVEASIAPLARRVDLTAARLRFAQAALAITGAVAWTGEGPDLDLTGTLDGLDVATLKTYWPHGLAGGGHDWVSANIEAGALPGAWLVLRVTPEMWEQKALPPEAFQLHFDMRDIIAHYRRPMPPLTHAHGHGVLNLDSLDLKVDKARMGGLAIAQGSFVIAPFSGHPQWAEARLVATGGARELLAVLDSEPLGYISGYGFSPSQAQGAARTQVRLRFPLVRSLTMEEIAVEGEIQTRSLAISGLLPEEEVSEGALSIALDNDGLVARGPVRLAGLSAQVEWRESFRGGDAMPTSLVLETAFDEADLGRFGLDLDERLHGRAALRLAVEGRGREISRGALEVDLRGLAIDEPMLGWRKAAGAPGSLTASLVSAEGGLLFKEGALDGGGLAASFALKIEADGHWRLDAPRVRLEDNDLALSAALGQSGWTVAVTGRQLDVRPFLARLYATAAPPPAHGAPAPWPELDVTMAVDRLLLANDMRLTDLAAGLLVRSNRITSLSLQGKLQESASLDLRLETDAAGTRRMELAASDAGLVARALDLFGNGQGGRLQASAQIRGGEAAMEIDGLATMSDFRVVRAPAMARVLSLASLTGFADLVRDGGIDFREMTLPFTLRRGVIDINEASANGPALGLTMNGQFVQSLEEADLRGVIVPAYGFNAIIGKVPVVGAILTGGENEGLFGINYRISGRLTDPEVSVNPASVLTPGILRKIFSRGKGTVTPPEQEREPAQTGTLEAAPPNIQ
ncbi:MAG: DUF3971 domain-containing protein [Pseudomonadota bacterium]